MRVGNEMGGVRGDVYLWWGRSKKEREGGYVGGGEKNRKEKRKNK